MNKHRRFPTELITQVRTEDGQPLITADQIKQIEDDAGIDFGKDFSEVLRKAIDDEFVKEIVAAARREA